MDFCKLKVDLVYRDRSRTVKATRINLLLNKQKQKQTKLVFCDVPTNNSGTLETSCANLYDVLEKTSKHTDF